ncbi:MAG: CCA tRNA nucleotidyltransferase [Spirochaetota bacterium]|nr:CCA tRNA nucleotidyltransferase [Spirochaetota bacterium]
MNKIEKLGEKIVNILTDNGFKAYFAGGCVRDKILGIPFKDIDIATSAQPNDVIHLFKKTIPVGVQFGVVIVMLDGTPFEVATFRKDINYKDGRHPESIQFTNETEDVKRRDFTINGILYDPLNDKIIDHVGGLNDINNKIIRCIGNPLERFKEDKLRMMRAIRFAARFSYKIDDQTWNGIKTLCTKIPEVSYERIRDELIKILTEGHANIGIKLLDESGILKEILPEISILKGVMQPLEYHPEGDVYNHVLLVLENLTNPSKELALAALLHDVGKPVTFSQSDRIRFNDHDNEGTKITKTICQRLKLSNKETIHITELVKQHMRFMNVQKMRESKLKRFLRQEHFNEHLELHRLDCLASHGKLDHYFFCINKLKEYASQNTNQLNPPKLIDGKKLIEIGYKPGPHFKEIINDVENAQLEGIINIESDAIDYVKSHYLINNNSSEPIKN